MPLFRSSVVAENSCPHVLHLPRDDFDDFDPETVTTLVVVDEFILDGELDGRVVFGMIRLRRSNAVCVGGGDVEFGAETAVFCMFLKLFVYF